MRPDPITISYGREGDMKCSCRMSFRGRSTRLLFAFVLGILILSACTPTTFPVVKKASAQCHRGHSIGFLRGFHSELVDASSGCPVYLSGVSWSGFESGTFASHGL